MTDNQQLSETLSLKLEDSSEETRYQAIKELRKLEVLTTIPLLMKALGDTSFRIREEALTIICSFPPQDMFPELEEFIRDHENTRVRNTVMEAIPRYGKEATPYLINLLKDSDEKVRMYSALMLGKTGDVEAVDSLIDALGDTDTNVKHSVIESLGIIGDGRAVQPVIDCLQEEFWIQFAAVVALGNIGDPMATDHLIRLLEKDLLKQVAIESLGKIGDPNAIPVLAKILKTGDVNDRNYIIAALVNIQSRCKEYIIPNGDCLPSIMTSLASTDLANHLLLSLKEPIPEVVKNAVIALGWLKEKRAVPHLVELLNEYELEEYVIASLASIGEGGLSELIQCLENPDPKVRLSLIRCISWIEDIEGIEACIPYLEDEDSDVRQQAVIAMTDALHLENVEDALIGMITDSDHELRNIVIRVVGQSTSGRIVDRFIPKLRSKSNTERLAAIEILGLQGDKTAFEPLREHLTDKSDEIRAAIYKALSSIQPGSLTTEILVAGISDSSPTVRKASASCLAEDAGEVAINNLKTLLRDEDPEIRLVAVESLGKMSAISAVENMLSVFKDGDLRLKMAIVHSMGHIRCKTTNTFLTDLLKEPDPDIKRAALESLAKVGDERCISPIIVTLDDPHWSVRNAAVSALAKIDDPRCVNSLLEKLNDEEDMVRRTTIAALGELGATEAVSSILPLLQDKNLQLEIIQTLERLGIPDLEVFGQFLRRANTQLKCLLVDLLGRLRDPRVIDCLTKSLEEDFTTVRCQAAKALGELGTRNSIPPLLKAKQEDPSEEVHKEAALALKKLGR